MTDELTIEEGRQQQDPGEEVIRSIDVTKVGTAAGTVTATSVKVYKESDGSDITTTVMPDGAPSIAGQVVALPLMKNLTTGESYLVVLFYTKDSSKMIEKLPVDCVPRDGVI